MSVLYGIITYDTAMQVWIPDRQDVWRLARLDRLTKECATVSIPGICDELFEVPRAHTRAWDPSHSLYLEVRVFVVVLEGVLCRTINIFLSCYDIIVSHVFCCAFMLPAEFVNCCYLGPFEPNQIMPVCARKGFSNFRAPDICFLHNMQTFFFVCMCGSPRSLR